MVTGECSIAILALQSSHTLSLREENGQVIFVLAIKNESPLVDLERDLYKKTTNLKNLILPHCLRKLR